MGKERFIVNPFQDIDMSTDDRHQLQELANGIVNSNLEHFNHSTTTGKRQVASRRWKHIKTREHLKVYMEKRKSAHADDGFSGSGLPMILCVGTTEGKLEDVMYGVTSEDLETMRLKASYVDDVSGAAVLDSIVQPSLEDPFQSLLVKWMEIDIPFASMNLVKNRDYVYLEGTGFVRDERGDRVGYHLLHSVSFPQTHELPNRIRGNVSITAFWRQMKPNTVEMYATGIFDPCGDLARKLVVPGMASAFLSSVRYSYCGQMRKLAFMLDKAYTESKQHGAPHRENICVTCSAPIGRRLGDFSKSSSTCKLCFGHVCQSCRVVRKLSFVEPDLMLARRKVTFCTSCMSLVTSMNAADCVRSKLLVQKNGVAGLSGLSSLTYGDIDSDSSFQQ